MKEHLPGSLPEHIRNQLENIKAELKAFYDNGYLISIPSDGIGRKHEQRGR